MYTHTNNAHFTYVNVMECFGRETRGERDHLQYPGVDGRILLRLIFRKWDVEAWNGSICLRIGTGGGHL